MPIRLHEFISLFFGNGIRIIFFTGWLLCMANQPLAADSTSSLENQALTEKPSSADQNSLPPSLMGDFNNEEDLKDQDPFLQEFLNMLATLGIIIVFIFFVSWFLKRMVNTRVQQLNTTSLIKIIERRALSPKSALYILEIDKKTLIIAETANGIAKIMDFPESIAPEEDFSK